MALQDLSDHIYTQDAVVSTLRVAYKWCNLSLSTAQHFSTPSFHFSSVAPLIFQLPLTNLAQEDFNPSRVANLYQQSVNTDALLLSVIDRRGGARVSKMRTASTRTVLHVCRLCAQLYLWRRRLNEALPKSLHCTRGMPVFSHILLRSMEGYPKKCPHITPQPHLSVVKEGGPGLLVPRPPSSHPHCLTY